MRNTRQGPLGSEGNDAPTLHQLMDTDGILMELFLDVVKMVRKLWIEMGKILLGVVVILKVHDEYGRREVRPAL